MTSLKNDNHLLSTRKVELFNEIEQLQQTAKLVDDKKSDINLRIQKTDTIKANITQELNKLPGSLNAAPIATIPSSGPPLPPPPPPKSSTPIPKKNVVKKAPDSQPKVNAQAPANKPDEASLSSAISKLRKTPVSPQQAEDNTENEPLVRNKIESLNFFPQARKGQLVSPNIPATKQRLSSKEGDAAYKKQIEEKKAAYQKEINEATLKQRTLAEQVSNLIAKLDAIKKSQQVHEVTLKLETDFIQQIDTKTEALSAMHGTVANDVTHELSKIAQKEAAKKAEVEAASQSKENASMGNKAPPAPPAPPPPPPPGPPSAKAKGFIDKNKSVASNAEIKKSPGSSAAQPISQSAIQEKHKHFQEKREQQAVQDYLVNELIDILDRRDGFEDYTDDQKLLLQTIDKTQLENLEMGLNKLPKSTDDASDDTLKNTLAKRRESLEGNDEKVMRENPQVKNAIIDFITNHPERDKLLESTKNIKQAKEDAQAKAAQEALQAQLDKISAYKEENERIKTEKIQSLIEENVGNAVNDFSSIVADAESKKLAITQTIKQQQQKLSEIDRFIIKIQADLEQKKAHLIDEMPSNPLPAASDTPQAAKNEEPARTSDDVFELPIKSPEHAEETHSAQAEEMHEEVIIDDSTDVLFDSPPQSLNHAEKTHSTQTEKVHEEVVAEKSVDSIQPVKTTPSPKKTELSLLKAFDEALAQYKATAKDLRAPGRIDVDRKQQDLGAHMLRVCSGLEMARDEYKKDGNIELFIVNCGKFLSTPKATTPNVTSTPGIRFLGELKKIILSIKELVGLKTNKEIAKDKQSALKAAFEEIKASNPEISNTKTTKPTPH